MLGRRIARGPLPPRISDSPWKLTHQKSGKTTSADEEGRRGPDDTCSSESSGDDALIASPANALRRSQAISVVGSRDIAGLVLHVMHKGAR